MKNEPIDALSAASIGKTIEQLGQQMKAQATMYAEQIGARRASMEAVAAILSERARAWQKMAEGLRYDEPNGIRHAMDVHVSLLLDLAGELKNPGTTKYAPPKA